MSQPRAGPRPSRSRSDFVRRACVRRQDRQSGGGVRRARQDHRPHHHLRGRAQRDGAVRHAAGHAARLLLAPADRYAAHRRLRPGRRDRRTAHFQADLLRLDVRRQPRPARRRASDLRRVAGRCKGGTTVIKETPPVDTATTGTDNPDSATDPNASASPQIDPSPPPKKKPKPKAPASSPPPCPPATTRRSTSAER